MKKKADVIVCPCCGAEYLPAEIFIPESYVGKPKNILKDEEGKIFAFDGESMNTSEKYQCDFCSNSFRVFAKTTFSTEMIGEFSTEYVSPRYQKIELCED